MGAPKGNRFWEVRSSHGRKPIFENPEDLWEAACEYFKWVEDNPLHEEKAFHFQGRVIKEPIEKMRAMTIQGLCLFLDITRETYYAYKEKKDFSDIVRLIDDTIYQQKLTGAAADLLNANIIARELKLKDSVESDLRSSDGSMTPSSVTLTNEQVSAIAKGLDDEY